MSNSSLLAAVFAFRMGVFVFSMGVFAFGMGVTRRAVHAAVRQYITTHAVIE